MVQTKTRITSITGHEPTKAPVYSEAPVTNVDKKRFNVRLFRV